MTLLTDPPTFLNLHAFLDMQDGQSDVFVMRLSTAIAIRTHCKNGTRRVDGWFPCIDVDTARKHGKEVVTTLVGPEAPVLKYLWFGGTGTCCQLSLPKNTARKSSVPFSVHLCPRTVVAALSFNAFLSSHPPRDPKRLCAIRYSTPPQSSQGACQH